MKRAGYPPAYAASVVGAAESPTGATHLYESVGMYRRLVGFDFHKWPQA